MAVHKVTFLPLGRTVEVDGIESASPFYLS